MIEFTPSAREKMSEILKAKGQEGFAIRLKVTGRDAENFQYEFRSVEMATLRDDDTVVDAGPFRIFVDPDSAPHLTGAVIDFTGLGSGGFKIDNPNPVWLDDTARAVADIVAKEINPSIAMHSGSISLVDVKDGKVYIKMHGGCQGCGAANVTLKLGIERRIKEAVPQISEVVDITDHDQGATPYYAAGAEGKSPVVSQ